MFRLVPTGIFIWSKLLSQCARLGIYNLDAYVISLTDDLTFATFKENCKRMVGYQDKQLFLLKEKDVLLEVKKTGEINQDIKDVIEDPFVGLVETTHSFADKDLYYFRLQSYRSTRWNIKRNRMTKYEAMFKVIKKCKIIFILEVRLDPLEIQLAVAPALHSGELKIAA